MKFHEPALFAKKGSQLASERVEKELSNLIEGVVPGLTDKAKKGIQHASE